MMNTTLYPELTGEAILVSQNTKHSIDVLPETADAIANFMKSLTPAPKESALGTTLVSDVCVEQLVDLRNLGFPAEFLDEAEMRTDSVTGNLVITTKHGQFTFFKNAKGQYECSTSFDLLSIDSDLPAHKDFGNTLFVTKNPLVAILGASLGVTSVAISGDAWLDQRVTQPLPVDVIHAIQAAIPTPALAKMAEGRDVVLDSSFEHSHLLGHSLKYHVDCKAYVWPHTSGPRLSLSNMVSGGQEMFQKKADPLKRAFVSYAYDEIEGQILRNYFPICYINSDEVMPLVEKEVLLKTTGENGEEEFSVKRVRMDNVPHCRIKKTVVVNASEGGVVNLSRSSGAAQVIELMEGFTSTRRYTEWEQRSADYNEKTFVDRDFTKTTNAALPGFRSFLAAQKGQKGHPIVFGTHARGYIGLKFPDGKTVYPAGYIAEDSIVMKGGMPSIVPLGAKTNGLSRKGSAKQWRKIMKVLLKNSSIAALMGFGASILIHPFVQNAEPGMIVLVGKSGFGKSSALRAVASMLSEPTDSRVPSSPMMSFRSTDNGLEGRFEAKNHFLAMIDEIGAASAGMDWAALAYMITNGMGRLRMNADSSARETKTWTTQTLATGEESFLSKMAAKGQAERGGILFRVIDLHLASNPIWEHLAAEVRDGALGDYQSICDEYNPEANQASQVMEALFQGLKENHGHCWWEMVEKMLDESYRKFAADRFKQWQIHFTSKLEDRSEPIVHRRSVHLASALAGLELILDTMTEELSVSERQALIDGASQWVETYLWRAGLPDGVVDEDKQLVEKVLEHMMLNPGRFYNPLSDHAPHNIKQYWGVNLGNSGVLVFISGLKDICKEIGEDKSRVKYALMHQAEGVSWVDDNQRPVPGAHPMRYLQSPESFRLLG